MKPTRWVKYSVFAGVLLVLASSVYVYLSWTRPREVAEFLDISHGSPSRILVVKRSVLFTGSVWDLRVEVYEGSILVAVETILKHRDSPWDFPPISDVTFDTNTRQLSLHFERDGKVFRILVKADAGEYTLDELIKSGRAVELNSGAK